MASFREALAKLGVAETEAVSWRGFPSVPDGISAAIRSANFINFPNGDPPISEIPVDENWTEECQGTAVYGDAWLFTSDGSKGTSDGARIYGNQPKALYRFKPGGTFDDDDIANKLIFAVPQSHDYTNICPLPPGGGPIYHIGAVCAYGDDIFVDHWNKVSFGHLAKVRFDGRQFHFIEWIPIEPVMIDGSPQRLNMVGINPWDGTLVTCTGAETPIDTLYIHDLQSGKLLNRQYNLSPNISPKQPMYIQGGCFSDDGRLYIAMGKSNIRNYQYISCYSALTGRYLYYIAVLTEGADQELEGICFARTNDGKSQLHAVLLENLAPARDNIFFKSYSVG